MSEQPALPASRTAAGALALKVAGASYDDIARTLGLANDLEAREAVERTLATMSQEIDGDTKNRERALANARIERLLRSVFTKATTPQDPEHLAAVGVAARLMERHAKLWGLDAPTQVTVTTPTAVEIEAWVAAVLEQQTDQITVEEDDVIVVGEVVTADDNPAA